MTAYSLVLVRVTVSGAQYKMDECILKHFILYSHTSFSKEKKSKAAQEGIPPSPVSLQLLMGQQFPTKMQNIAQGIAKGIFAPVIMVGRKPQIVK